MRLTNKAGIAYSVEDFTNCYEAIDKLGRIEDTEEEFGIDLTTLFKALTNGIYTREFGFVKGSRIWIDRNFIGIPSEHAYLPLANSLSGYGYSWALTKEELK